MVSTRGGFKASQARILGKGLTPVEITIPPLQMSGSADTPIIAAWGYTDGSLAIKHRDQNRNEKSLAWSARRKKWFHSDADRGLAELLKDLSLDIPIGTATALEAEKLWNKAKKWFGSKSSESDEEEFDEDEIE
jgi:post-segregation antitoxin (ccd killing protein)